MSCLCPPVTLESCKGSCVFQALDVAAPPISSIAGLREVCKHVKVCILSEAPDDHSGNGRCMKHLRELLPKNCLRHRSTCLGHAVHRVVENTTKEKDVIGDVHAVVMCCSLTSNQQKLLDALWYIIDTELDVVAGFPPISCRAHSESVWSHTLFRSSDHVGGSIELRLGELGPIAALASTEQLHRASALDTRWSHCARAVASTR